MTQQVPVHMRLEWTPNPNTIKYMVNRNLLEVGAANFPTKDNAQKAPLPKKLFDVTGVEGVMVGKNFVTVTKSEEADWEEVHENCSQIIQGHLEADETVLGDYMAEVAGGAAGASHEESTIRRILDEEIRPAVAQDGGDITFEKYENGVLFLHMKGSCAGCPSSTMTLKMGIETRLREEIPDLVEIVPV